MDIRIFVDGHVDDLYALSLLFPQGAYPGLNVITGLKGGKDGPMDRVHDTSDHRTYVTGEACLPLAEAQSYGAAIRVAREIISPINGYAVLADSNFKIVVPISAEIRHQHGGGHMSFNESASNTPRRLISVDRHPNLSAMRNQRVDLMTSKPLAAYAALVMSGSPNWADYYRLLEDIAGDSDTTLDKLSDTGFARRQTLIAFKSAANNRAFGRHGTSKRDTTIDQSSLMNLLEAREFVRGVVTRWLDAQCGDVLPTDRVDGGSLRFGLDDHD